MALWLQNPQRTGVMQLQHSGDSVTADMTRDPLQLGQKCLRTLHKNDTFFPLTFTRNLSSPVHALRSRTVLTSCSESVQPPDVRSHCGRVWGDGLEMCVCVCVEGGCSLGKKGPCSFTFYQKEQLFPVLGHRWYCVERKKRAKERSLQQSVLSTAVQGIFWCNLNLKRLTSLNLAVHIMLIEPFLVCKKSAGLLLTT